MTPECQPRNWRLDPAKRQLQMVQKVRESSAEATERLRAAGLRPTRQRVELVGLLYAGGHRHMTAESLHADAMASGV